MADRPTISSLSMEGQVTTMAQTPHYPTASELDAMRDPTLNMPRQGSDVPLDNYSYATHPNPIIGPAWYGERERGCPAGWREYERNR